MRNIFCNIFQVLIKVLKHPTCFKENYATSPINNGCFLYFLIRRISRQGMLDITSALYSEGNLFESTSICDGVSYALTCINL